jgi:hypothetical protein
LLVFFSPKLFKSSAFWITHLEDEAMAVSGANYREKKKQKKKKTLKI